MDFLLLNWPWFHTNQVHIYIGIYVYIYRYIDRKIYISHSIFKFEAIIQLLVGIYLIFTPNTDLPVIYGATHLFKLLEGRREGQRVIYGGTTDR